MEQDPSIRAAMLKSDHKAIFCAGIDFQEFLKGPERFVAYPFYEVLNSSLRAFYSAPFFLLRRP